MWSSNGDPQLGRRERSTHAGVAPCQTSAWPFTFMPCASAKSTIRSPPEKSKTPGVFWTGSHFISHSAVT